MFIPRLHNLRRAVSATLLAAAIAATCAADPSVQISVDTGASGTPVPPTLHGIFFEDINYGADGGLYAELVENRSFEHRDRLYGWKLTRSNENLGNVKIEEDAPLNENNPHFARMTRNAGEGELALSNDGLGSRWSAAKRICCRSMRVPSRPAQAWPSCCGMRPERRSPSTASGN